MDFNTEEFQFLPAILEILRRLKESSVYTEADVMKEIQSLQEKFLRCHKMLRELPGGDLTKEEQMTMYEMYLEKLQSKCSVLARYSAVIRSMGGDIERPDGPVPLLLSDHTETGPTVQTDPMLIE
mmetsp:Transcript_19417/g.33375  ORF Transcript_19417/g.33375 Transcript_19417/m.33375 type:complete len:125 (-) Transcript_19417:216-590(-)|eukprot:CAMPEP_0196653142 /NCGR_PEP_ID=MMETSP1086-20130531/2743_1 /TAXON_ID=77921 /ORGANISM="Cyanoptyche  gloeocystis , Strain SAG4.97" /LENGTH=124 /DNA_ID=CAMNT_0041984185 /DNA_START=112 /DNA_END=486 /DNA_ORIENTATION=+